MIERKDAKNIAYLLSQIRSLSHSHLPLSHSFIPYDILLTILSHTLGDQPPSIKALFASLKHSESGTRYHFERLINMGWIDLMTHDKDSRVKLCSINKNYEARANKYLAEVEQLIFEVSNGIRSSQLCRSEYSVRASPAVFFNKPQVLSKRLNKPLKLWGRRRSLLLNK
jgi:hypothetical protein